MSTANAACAAHRVEIALDRFTFIILFFTISHLFLANRWRKEIHSSRPPLLPPLFISGSAKDPAI
ncbi:hypothetical protein F4604DRAFT_1914907 [Suillus subluteus]|nr:hypothetical protein F4604DRAFT_1914907 [Suillus subluteus]